ncbi:protein tyrosine phosphatase-like domain-containing protein [Bacteriovoracales bacterium]|nr:protein tyrosine phosphatase-like domain-containing protein [Bacteriovoracales bacterium]
MKKLYLLTYNFISLTLWLNIYFNMFFADNFYVEVVSIIKLVQTLACLEIIHSFLGLSSSVKVPSILQITARLIFVWIILEFFPETRTGWPFYAMVGSWSLIEVVRYSYYFLKVKDEKKVPYFVTWLRYNLFFILYPLGFAGEVGCLLKANLIKGPWLLILIPYFLALIFMMKHMLYLRNKKLGIDF